MRQIVLIINIFFLLICSKSYAQLVEEYSLPILGDSIVFCSICSNEFVVDEFWQLNGYIYTKLKFDEFEYILFQKTDSIFQIRKYLDGDLKSKGDILLKSSKEHFRRSVSKYLEPSFYELTEIFKFIEPTKIGYWISVDSIGIISKGKFDNFGNKIETWKYIQNDTVFVNDFEAGLRYYINPKSELIERNISWLIKEFKTIFLFTKAETLEEIFGRLDEQSYKISLQENYDQIGGHLVFDFNKDGQLNLLLMDTDELKIKHELRWKIKSDGTINLIDTRNKKWSFKLGKFGEKIIWLQSIEK